jgi:hypothetical protein
MKSPSDTHSRDYRHAMGQLLALYTQVDALIGDVCAERIGTAPDEAARRALTKQVGDEGRHVAIQHEWMAEFGTDPRPLVDEAQAAAVRAHFRDLPWLDFLADLYVAVEALGGEAVQEIVPVADPGTRESLRIPLADEVDHVAFGLDRIRHELAGLPEEERHAFLARLPQRIDSLAAALHGMGIDLKGLFQAVGVPYAEVRDAVLARRAEVLEQLAS